jgi:hypothetical protein
MAGYNDPPNWPKPKGYRGVRRRSPFAAMTGAVSAALLARGHRVRSTLVFGAICIVLLAVIAAIIVGVPKKSTTVGKVTAGALKASLTPTVAPPASATPPASREPSPAVSPLLAGAAAAAISTATPSPSPTPTPTPTPTATPTPTLTPTPPPAPTTCAASVSDATPTHDEMINVVVQTAPGAHVTVTAHYRTERTTHHASADSSGGADVPFDVLNAIYGFNVRVVVVASGAGGTADCSTSFTPAP